MMRLRPAAVLRTAIVQVTAVALALAAPAALAHESAAAAPSASPSSAHSTVPFLGVIGQAPDFTLQDRRGEPLQLSQLMGRPVLLSFIFTQCASACPLLSQQMQRLQDRLAQTGAFPARVAL